MRGVQGRVVARFNCVNGRTQLAESICQTPLKIAKAFPLRDGRAGVCVMDCSPGLLAGDAYDLSWHLAADADVLLTPQGFTRVHPSVAAPCRLTQRITIESGACLECENPPIMLYREASLHAECEVDLGAGGALVFSEIACAGRIERGEAFAFHRYQSRLRVRSEGKLLCYHNVSVAPALWNVKARGAWAGRTHWGQVWALCESLSAAQQQELKTRWRDILGTGAARWPTLTGGVGRLERGGIVATLLGGRAWELQEAAQQMRECARMTIKHGSAAA